MNERHALYAFAATLAAICYLATIAAVLAYANKYVEALGFGGLTIGLVGVIGTFKPRTTGASDQQNANLATMIDKLPPATTGTGPAEPVETKP